MSCANHASQSICLGKTPQAAVPIAGHPVREALFRTRPRLTGHRVAAMV
jgi:hypothetical protein